MNAFQALQELAGAIDDLQSLAEAVGDDRLANYDVERALQVLENVVQDRLVGEATQA